VPSSLVSIFLNQLPKPFRTRSEILEIPIPAARSSGLTTQNGSIIRLISNHLNECVCSGYPEPHREACGPLDPRCFQPLFNRICYDRMSIQAPPVKKEEPANHPTAEDGPAAVVQGSFAAAGDNPAGGNPVAAEGTPAAVEGSLAAAYIVHIAEREA
jgi:hypothetical protein